jgi:hypothetical protein
MFRKKLILTQLKFIITVFALIFLKLTQNEKCLRIQMIKKKKINIRGFLIELKKKN